MIRVFIYHRTARGGGKVNRSILLPFAWWLLLRLVWIAGIPYEDMVKYVRDFAAHKCKLDRWKKSSNNDNGNVGATENDTILDGGNKNMIDEFADLEHGDILFEI